MHDDASNTVIHTINSNFIVIKMYKFTTKLHVSDVI